MIRVDYMTRFALVALTALVVGCTGVGQAPPPEAELGAREEYVIGIPDVLRIVVWRNDALSVLVPVRRDGKISVPLVDDVQAAGLTPHELKEVLTEALAEYVTAPDVTVIVQETNSHTVTVVGGVLRSGQLPLTRDMRVIEAIATMGGFTIGIGSDAGRKLDRRPGARVLRRESSRWGFERVPAFGGVDR